jgi:biotin transporter BioY
MKSFELYLVVALLAGLVMGLLADKLRARSFVAWWLIGWLSALMPVLYLVALGLLFVLKKQPQDAQRCGSSEAHKL